MKRLGIHDNRFTVGDLVQIMLCLYFVISIAETYLNGLIGSVTKYYIFLVMFALMYMDGFKLQLRKISIVYMIWLALKLLSLVWTEDYTIPKLHFISQFGMVAFLVVLLAQERSEKLLRSALDTYWFASVVLGILTIFFARTYMGENEARQVLVVLGVEIDPNNQAALLLVGIAISISNILYEKRRIVLSVIGLLINVYTCFATSSRGALVTIIAILLFCVFYSTEKEKKFKAIVLRLFVVGLAVWVVYYLTVRYLPEASFNRLFDFESYEGGSERDRLWSTVWEQYTQHPVTVLFGTGWGTAYVYLEGSAVHNTFLTFLSDIGLVGALLFMVPMAVAALRLLKENKPTPVLLLVAQMIPSFFIDAINKRFFWNAVFILCLYYYMQKEESKKASSVADDPLLGEQE